jgi:hypothetical protein
MMTTEEAMELVRRKWDDSGECKSCGHHACLYEYGDLADAIWIDEEKQRVELSCLSGDENSDRHRGVRIPFDAPST